MMKETFWIPIEYLNAHSEIPPFYLGLNNLKINWILNHYKIELTKGLSTIANLLFFEDWLI